MSTKPGDEAPPWTHFYRVYCTNKDWEGCLNVCNTGNNAKDVVQLTPCDNTNSSEKWCCGDTTNCCMPGSKELPVIIPRFLGNSSAPLPSSPLSPSSSSSRSASSSSSAPISSSPDPTKRQRDIGIGIGVGLGVPVILALGFAFGIYYMKRHRTAPIVTLETYNHEEYKVPDVYMAELDAPGMELPAGRQDVELPSLGDPCESPSEVWGGAVVGIGIRMIVDVLV
ncbi:hypothetical protein GQ44DRAFT_729483 [Phaeosphaeriaceae sp. PMI808]|nr:hypothetical protein GQ44DRAFT_729483 [Phaeosphaeriaceae sp. PMI808]